jgi:hypothetical protein
LRHKEKHQRQSHAATTDQVKLGQRSKKQTEKSHAAVATSTKGTEPKVVAANSSRNPSTFIPPHVRETVLTMVLREFELEKQTIFRKRELDFYPHLVQCLHTSVFREYPRSFVREVAYRSAVLGTVYWNLMRLPGALDITEENRQYPVVSVMDIDMKSVLERAYRLAYPEDVDAMHHAT